MEESRERKCEWSLWSCIFKFPIFHAQISHHRLYDQIRYSDFFFGCTWMILRSHTFALYATNFWCAQKFKKENWIFFIGKNKDWNPNDDLIFFFSGRELEVESARRGCACGWWWWWSWCEHLFMSTAYIWKEERCVLRCSKQETQSPFSRILQIKLTSVNSWIVIDQYTNFVTHWR